MLELVALALALVHFGFPLAYYWYAKTRWLDRPWNVKVDASFKPKVTIIVPTYNEAELIIERLNNLYNQDYPKNLIEVIVVDSASTDGTPEMVEEWSRRHPDFKLTLLKEHVRRGMVPALSYALKWVSDDAEVVVFTDADAYWPCDALTKVMKYFTDPNVGAVTVRIAPLSNDQSSEKVYRDYYNVLRVAESKVHSTPVHNAPLMAFRAELIRKIGLPTYTGNNDSTPASIIAFMGYRAIAIEEVTVKELLRERQFYRKVRRAQHLILSFLKTKKYVKRLGLYVRSSFNKIWRIEWWLHTVNPWLLAISALLLTVSAIFYKSTLALALMGTGLILLLSRAYRAWVTTQLCLVIASIRNTWTKEIAWSK